MSASKWAGVDWSKSTSAIAKERGVAISTVSKARGRYAPETLGAYSTRDKSKPVDDLQKRLKEATARADGLQRELEQARKQLAVARRAFATTEALMRDVLAERDAAIAKLTAGTGRPPATAGPRSPRTQHALAEALDLHPDLAEGFRGGTLTDAWHNPGAASGVETHNHP